MRFWDKFALTTVLIALSFASCNFPVAVQFFPKSHSRLCDYLYTAILRYTDIKIPPIGGLGGGGCFTIATKICRRGFVPESVASHHSFSI